MLRVTTLYASTASATAGYYTKYLTQADGEMPGVWAGDQAARFGLSGAVEAGQLERLLMGCDPTTGATLGQPLVNRVSSDGRVVRAVSGFDATVSAPKSLSAWWALTGDQSLLDAHDVAVTAVIATLQRYGATTRIRSNGGRVHPDTQGLTIAAFRQSTSRLDDPQIHTHVVISAKVQVNDGRWFALDARTLKKHQRTLGGVYQSVLRAELSERFGVRFDAIVNGQAEINGVPQGLLEVFSKRAVQVDQALTLKEAEFRGREQREPSRFERAAMQREAAADTRRNKTGNTLPDLRTRWIAEAADVGVTATSLQASIDQTARTPEPVQHLTTGDIERVLTERASTWHRLDVLRAVTDQIRPQTGLSGERWLAFLERCTDSVIDASIDLDPTITDERRRSSDGRSVWVEPIAARYTNDTVLAQEEHIAVWAMDRQTQAPRPSSTVHAEGLDEMQAEAAAAVAGSDQLVIVVGPAGSGKTTMLARAVDDLTNHARPVFAVAPTAKAARVLARETGAPTDTVAKLLHEWTRPDRPPGPTWNLPHGTSLIVDEAGMLNTGDLHTLTRLATANEWRVALLGDAHQLHAVGRGGMFDELCTSGRVHELTQIHRFSEWWEPSASLALRRGDPRAIASYVLHDRVTGGTIEQHLATLAVRWQNATTTGQTIAITAATNDHGDLINTAIQRRRVASGDITTNETAVGMNGGAIHVGDHIATRRNERRLRTSSGDMVRNRETWTVTQISDTGDLDARRHDGNDTVTLPAGYVAEHVQLGYATTEPGNQGDTHDIALALITPATTSRGLYVAMTRGRAENSALVVTNDASLEAAVDVLNRVLASDRADRPAVAQRRELAAQIPPTIRVQQPQPRCTVPDWWHTLRTATFDALITVQADLDKMRDLQDARVEQRNAARSKVDNASTELNPYHQAYAAASRRLDSAESAHNAAEAHLDKIGLRGRRTGRHQLNDARVELADARREFESINVVWQPLRQTADKANRSYQLLRETYDMQDRIDNRRQLPERHQTLTAQLDALDTWRHWAAGGNITTEAATFTVEVLGAINDPHYRALGAAIYDVTPELVAEPEPPAVEYRYAKVDFGIDP
jgi:conjugative relaxase-like TrwC/TraI family protein